MAPAAMNETTPQGVIAAGRKMSVAKRVTPLLTLLAVLGSCALFYRTCVYTPPKRSVLSKTASPDGKYMAYVELLDSGGGATVGYNCEIVVRPTSEPFDVQRDATWIWLGWSTFPKRIYWKDCHTGAVVLTTKDQLGLTEIETQTQFGIRTERILVE